MGTTTAAYFTGGDGILERTASLTQHFGISRVQASKDFTLHQTLYLLSRKSYRRFSIFQILATLGGDFL